MLQTPTRHTKALLDLADYFERMNPDAYDQTKFTNCICGWCNIRSGRTYHDTKAAAQELGLSYAQSNRLFSGEAGRKGVYLFGLWSHTHLPTSKDAARCLRHIAVTGDLPGDW